MIAVFMAVLIGYMAYRRPPSTVGLLWLCALALSLRCFFESVMVPFYLGPPLALIVLTAATCMSWKRLVGAWAIAVVATVFSFHRFSEWGYWLPMVAFLAIGLACAWPGRADVGIFGLACRSVLQRSIGEPDGLQSLQRPHRVLATRQPLPRGLEHRQRLCDHLAGCRRGR